MINKYGPLDSLKISISVVEYSKGRNSKTITIVHIFTNFYHFALNAFSDPCGVFVFMRRCINLASKVLIFFNITAIIESKPIMALISISDRRDNRILKKRNLI
ncbi:hypothetical protein ACJX0J_005833 [Zea mays]